MPETTTSTRRSRPHVDDVQAQQTTNESAPDQASLSKSRVGIGSTVLYWHPRRSFIDVPAECERIPRPAIVMELLPLRDGEKEHRLHLMLYTWGLAPMLITSAPYADTPTPGYWQYRDCA
jgi:hypothetical protein